MVSFASEAPSVMKRLDWQTLDSEDGLCNLPSCCARECGRSSGRCHSRKPAVASIRQSVRHAMASALRWKRQAEYGGDPGTKNKVGIVKAGETY